MAAEVRVLGPLEMKVDGWPVDLGGCRPRQVLAALALDVGRSVPTERLVDLVWSDDPPASARTQIAIQISTLRKALEDQSDLIATTSEGYRLVPDDVWVDAAEAEGVAHDTYAVEQSENRIGRLRSALGLWRGTPFAGFLTAGLEPTARRLEELRTTLAEDLYAGALELGHHREIIAELRSWVADEPLNERFRELLMTALWRSGGQMEALEVYRVGRSLLIDQLGIEPNAQLQGLHQAVLRDDGHPPALDRSRSSVVPAQLPHSPYGFVGRQDQLDALSRLGDGSDGAGSRCLVVVTGTAGAGKTALVTHWAQKARELFPDGQLYVDLQGFSSEDPVPPHRALGAFLRALGEGSGLVPEDPHERAARFRTVLDGRRLLIVLDNASGAEQVRMLLPGGESCFVVVTSRSRLAGLTAGDGAHRLELEPMSPDDARDVLAMRVGAVDLTSAPVLRLIDRCAGLPLALRIVADRVRDAGSLGVPGIVDRLDTDKRPLDVLETGDEHTSVRAVLSWSYRQLSTAAAHLFRLCGFRCAHTAHFIDLRGVSALLDSDLPTARRLMGELVGRGLAEELPGECFRMHDLIQDYATELCGQTDIAAEAQERLLGAYLRTAVNATSFIRRRETALLSGCPSSAAPDLRDLASALHWLDVQRPSLLCAAETTAENRLLTYTVDLSTTLWPYLARGEHLDESGRIHTLARTAAQALEERTAEGIVVRALGIHEWQRGRPDDAERLLHQALDLHSRNHEKPLRETTLEYLASITRS